MDDDPPTKARLYVETTLAEGGTVALADAQAHYLRNVLRLAPGSAVALFNGSDGEWLARIEGMDKRSARLALLRRTRPQREEPDLWLLFAPVKRARIDYLVEKATELGAAELRPVLTRRTVVERVNLERLRANAVEAAEQTERLSVPVVRPAERLDAALARWPGGRKLIFCDETGTALPIDAAIRGLHMPLAVLIGPEGGFDEGELDALRKLAFVKPVGLGPRVLRADTAALAALAVVQSVVGDWNAPRPH
jgi:16S rRNA (uracil1498-N3)-methyltransferase